MSNVKQKREKVLEKLYDELLENDLDEILDRTYSGSNAGDKKGQHPMVQMVVALENARASDEDVALRGDILAFDNANREIDREKETNEEFVKLLVTSGVAVVTNIVWGMIFVHEMRATRQFEIDGTETSAAGRWLKTSFPKVGRLF